jgi:hypothetical protein
VRIIISHKIESSQSRANKSKCIICNSFTSSFINFKTSWSKDIIVNDMLTKEIIKNFPLKLVDPQSNFASLCQSLTIILQKDMKYCNNHVNK